MSSAQPDKPFISEQEAFAALTKKQYGKAADIYRALLGEVPGNPTYWFHLSNALQHLAYREAALGAAKRASALAPTDLDLHINESNCLCALNRLNDALPLLINAVASAPQNVIYRRKYITALREANKLDEALAAADQALILFPDDVELKWQRSVTLLTLGGLVAGWPGYEMRWQRGRLKEKGYGSAPRWTGQDLTGKTLLLHEEQGFGDTIHMSRYIPLLKQRGARVVFECRPSLHGLFKEIPGLDRLPAEGPLGEWFDYHVPVLSLPGVFKTELETIPPLGKLCSAEIPPPEAVRFLALTKNRFKVGIVWSGNTDFQENYKRAASFSNFLPLAEIPHVQLYSLQKGTPEKELQDHAMQGIVPELGPYLGDFAQTAAVIKELDLLITTDTAVAHLAGALGCPVWTLLHSSPHWLYLANRSDSPWYPSMRLFRQTIAGDWEGVFREVADALRKAAVVQVK